MICHRPGRRRNGRFGGQLPPTENLNDFHNDFPPAGEAGGKKSKKYYYNNKTNNLLMMMMIFSLSPKKNTIILNTTKILQTLKFAVTLIGYPNRVP